MNQVFKNISEYFVKFKLEAGLWIIVLWQFISVGLISVGVWPQEIAWLNTAIIFFYLVATPTFYGLLLVVVSIPFYLALPNSFIPDLPMWRLVFAILFAIWLARILLAQQSYLQRILNVRRWLENSNPSTTKKELFSNILKRIDSRFMPWDKVAFLFIIIALFSLVKAKFPIHGLKQIVFIVNAYLIYLVAINTITDLGKMRMFARYIAYSLSLVLLYGFIQYLVTWFAAAYYVWQYWATYVSAAFYGQPLAEVLTYSNSWLTSGGAKTLRMFGIMQDTHSFGVLAFLMLGYLAIFYKTEALVDRGIWHSFKSQPKKVIAGIILAAYAVVASGTRGILVGMIPVLAISLALYFKKFGREYLKLPIAGMLAVLILVFVSPYITMAVNWIRTEDSHQNFLERAETIYDLEEQSNAGRLDIWRDSVVFAVMHPFGVGYGNFITSVVKNIPENSSFDQVAEKLNKGFNLPQKFITAHSLYLHILVELGFAGLLAFILFWREYAESVWRYVKNFAGSNSDLASLVAGVSLALLWILSYGVFDVTILNDRVLQFLFLSLAMVGLIAVKQKNFDR